MKESETLYRSFRLVRSLLLGTLILVVALIAFGYLFFMRGVDVPEARELAERELAGGMLRFGEKVQQKAHVYTRRSNDYFRGTNGVLAATNERLIFIGVAPQDNLESPDAPPAIVDEQFVNDTVLEMKRRRVFLLSASGIVVRRDGREISFASTSDHRKELDELERYVTATHEAQRTAAARERRLRQAVERIVTQPLYYTVRRGDAISTIANTFGTTVERLQAWNNLSGPKIKVGQRLLVKPAGDRAPPLAAPALAAVAVPEADTAIRARRPRGQ